MRVLPILTAAAIGAAVVSTAAFAQQAGPGSNQPPGQATTTQSSEQKMDASASGKKMKKAKGETGETSRPSRGGADAPAPSGGSAFHHFVMGG